MDVLSEVLRTVRLAGAVYLDAELTAPWTVASPPPDIVARVLAPNCDRVIVCHVVLRGRATVHVKGQRPRPLDAGDVLLLPRGDAHLVSDGAPRPAVDAVDPVVYVARGHTAVRAGGGGTVTRLICGYLGCAGHAGRHLLDVLPAALGLHVGADRERTSLEQWVRLMREESDAARPGHQALALRLSEALLVEAVRRYVAGLSIEPDWLAAARDPIVGRTLTAIRHDPARRWTIAALARQVRSSRSVVSQRFARFTGEPPITYLAHWRLQLGAQLLRTTTRSVLEVAYDVGYRSETGFIRAFKREFGEAPGRFRRHNGP